MITVQEIKEFWEKAGLTELDKDGLRPVARDPFLQNLVENSIFDFLEKDDIICDIGCGDGVSTKKFAQKVKKMFAIDYSKTLIEIAKNNNSLDNIEYINEDILNISDIFNDDFFDKIISIRCLINIPTEELQYRALEEIFKKLKKNGLLILSEGTLNELNNLNHLRKLHNLPLIEPVKYNLFFDTSKLENFINKYGILEKKITFGHYFYGSRIIQPLLVGVDKVKHTHPINEIFMQTLIVEKLDRYPEISYSSLYIIRKK